MVVSAAAHAAMNAATLAMPLAAQAATRGVNVLASSSGNVHVRSALRSTRWARAAATSAGAHLVRLGHAGGGFAAAALLVKAAEQAAPPVSPAMRCITILTVYYFSVYLGVICARACGRFSGRSGAGPTKFEEVLAEGTESVAPVPMVCIMMICARLRAMQLDPSLGNPQPWAQTCMYLCTWALLLHFLLRLFAPFIGNHEQSSGSSFSWVAVWAHKIACGTVAMVLYGGCAAIIASILVMRSPTLGAEGTPAPMPMMICAITLMILYFSLHATFELVQAFRATAFRKGSVEKMLDQAILTLQYTPMLCILLAGISMRSLQLELQTTTWANVAMYATTWAIVVQACLVVLVPLCLPGEAINVREDMSTHCLDWRKHSHPTVGCCTLSLSVLWWTTVISLYCGIAVILASVIMMEPQPHHILGLLVGPNPAASTAAVSTAMRCVMILTMLYFGIFLAIVIGRVAFDPSNKKLQSVFESAEQSLAFAPMLCVMMICVRLRAIQLHIRDPQSWAQVAMYVATWTVVIQVFAAVMIVCVTPSDDEEKKDSSRSHRSGMDPSGSEDLQDPPDAVEEDQSNLRRKFAVIGLLIVRYSAAACLYGAMAVLIVALFVMESDPLEKLAINPDMRTLMPE